MGKTKFTPKIYEKILFYLKSYSTRHRGGTMLRIAAVSAVSRKETALSAPLTHMQPLILPRDLL